VGIYLLCYPASTTYCGVACIGVPCTLAPWLTFCSG